LTTCRSRHNKRQSIQIDIPSFDWFVCHKKVITRSIDIGSCYLSDGWKYTPQKILSIKGTYFCMQAGSEGMPATLGIMCSDPNSRWEMISDSKLHLSSKLSDDSNVCLDVDDNNNIVTNACKCLSKDRTCDPSSQWFKPIDSGSRSMLTTSTSSMLYKFIGPFMEAV